MVDIFSACESGSVPAVRKAMRALTKSAAVGLNVNCFDIEGMTPLMFAANSGHDRVCLHLLKEGAKVDIPMFRMVGYSGRRFLYRAVRRQWTALHMAAQRGHSEVIRVLL